MSGARLLGEFFSILERNAPELRKGLEEGLNRLELVLDKSGAGSGIGKEIFHQITDGEFDGKGETNAVRSLSQHMVNRNFLGALYGAFKQLNSMKKKLAEAENTKTSQTIVSPILQRGAPQSLVPQYTSIHHNINPEWASLAARFEQLPEDKGISLLNSLITQNQQHLQQIFDEKTVNKLAKEVTGNLPTQAQIQAVVDMYSQPKPGKGN